ncbi:NAD(P)H-dependent flavin oxidoreductase [Brevibacterium album]|uniref:NAD(P)H-dependent flavin oxidoreductase n=1 Tax=Brevibacterium album TaxID=417948 RepID=UPI0003F70EC0|nr:nitronate monooxygenase family protein [Brevibacterium album]
MRTRITEALGIEHPIVQGGMQWVGTADLAAAVSEAGGLGLITARLHDSGEHLLDEIERARTLTSRPVGVNISISQQVSHEYGEWIEAVVAGCVPVVETAGNSPRPFLPRLKAHGIRVIHKCTTVRHALSAERDGADVISMDGFEAAGHPGEHDTPLMVAVPAAVRALRVPVLASGGIADGRGMAAALMLGAEGVNVGTRFMFTRESPVSEALKAELAASTSIYDTQLIQRSFGNTGRFLRNAVTEEIAASEDVFPGDFERIRHLVSGLRGRDALAGGDREAGLICASQALGLFDDIPSCAEVIARMMEECRQAVAGAAARS